MIDFGFQWHLTNRCNLRCVHCYQESSSDSSELDFDGQKQIASRIFGSSSLGSIQVNLTGGEPFLLSQLSQLVEWIRTYPNAEEVYVITNGTKDPDQNLARQLRGGGLTGLKVSLEAGDRVTNDGIRGTGNFDAVKGRVKELVQARFPVTLMMTLARYNVNSIEGMVELGKNIGVQGIIFERFVPIGRGGGLRDQALGDREFETAIRSIVRSARIDADSIDLAPYRALWLDMTGADGFEVRGARCNLGKGSMALMPDGSVFPCRRLPIPIGNILADSMEGILAKLSDHNPVSIGDSQSWKQCTECRGMNRSLFL